MAFFGEVFSVNFLSRCVKQNAGNVLGIIKLNKIYFHKDQ